MIAALAGVDGYEDNPREAAAMRSNIAYDTQDLWRKDRDHTIHGWCDFESFPRTGSEILVEGDGAYVFDSDGKRYLDGIGGVWCVNIGYGRDDMAEAIAEQARRLPYANPFKATTTPPAAELGAKLAELAPATLNHVFYSSGGSTANDTALRIVQHYFNHLGRPEKKQVLCRADAYHGSTSVTASLSGVAFNKIGFDTPELGVHHVSAPYLYRRPEGLDEAGFCDLLVEEFARKVAELGAERVAAFFAEPIMGMGGVIVPPAGYFGRLAEICRANDILIVADEVVTGFCRLGEFFASDSIFEMAPDIVTSAKGLTSGYLPLGATLISDRIHEVIAKPYADGAMFTHGFTYSGHPICCAAALRNIEIMEREDLCGRVRETGPYFIERLRGLLDLPLVGDVRGMNFMAGVESVADKSTKALLPVEAHVGDRVAAHARARGLILRPLGHLNVLSPPLILTRDQIDEMVDVLRESFLATGEELSREGLWKG